MKIKNPIKLFCVFFIGSIIGFIIWYFIISYFTQTLNYFEWSKTTKIIHIILSKIIGLGLTEEYYKKQK